MEVCDCFFVDVLLCDEYLVDMCICNKYCKKLCGMFREENIIDQEYGDVLKFFLKIIEDIVNGLDFLYYNGFVYRDLKLLNILVSIFLFKYFKKKI